MAPDRVTIVDVVLGSLPFIVAMVLLIGLMILVPDIAMWLVRKMSA
jgi:C4-dicarboxylate transporter, DctM subunit